MFVINLTFAKAMENTYGTKGLLDHPNDLNSASRKDVKIAGFSRWIPWSHDGSLTHPK